MIPEGIISEPTDGVPNDILIKALEQDIRGELEVCKLGCADCPKGLNCQTLGNPDRARYLAEDEAISGGIGGAGFTYSQYTKPSSHLQALSYIEHCHRPLGIASRVGVNLYVKQEYMWGTPLVPIRAKLRVLGRMLVRLEEELRRGHVAAERDLESMSSAQFRAIDAIKKTLGDTTCFIDRSESGDIVRRLFRESNSQPAIAYAFRACCCRLPELLGNGGWSTYWSFASDCRESGLAMATGPRVHDAYITDGAELQRQITELATEVRKE